MAGYDCLSWMRTSDSLAQRYALRRNIKLGERLGFGIHGTVFAVEDNTKPGFFAVKFHREKRPFELECRVYQRLREEQIREFLASMCLSCCALMRNSAR